MILRNIIHAYAVLLYVSLACHKFLCYWSALVMQRRSHPTLSLPGIKGDLIVSHHPCHWWYRTLSSRLINKRANKAEWTTHLHNDELSQWLRSAYFAAVHRPLLCLSKRHLLLCCHCSLACIYNRLRRPASFCARTITSNLFTFL